jgi:hypothetical protein
MLAKAIAYLLKRCPALAAFSTMARLSRNPRKFLPKCELPHTSRPVLALCCLKMGGWGALANAGSGVRAPSYTGAALDAMLIDVALMKPSAAR